MLSTNPILRSSGVVALCCGAALFGIAGPTPSMAAAPHCMARILADVPAEEAPEQVKSKSNGEFGPITKLKVNKSTGKMLYCGAGTYCYNSNAFELSTPCRIKLDKVGEFGDYFTYFTR
jgi:hypothetical protein